MAYLQIDDVLDNVRQFHASLARHYDTLSRSVSNARLAEILGRLRDEEELVASALRRFCAQTDESTAKTWLQFDPDPELWRVREHELTPAWNTNPEQAISLALRMDSTLHSIWDKLAGSQVPPRMQEMFRELAEMQRSRMRRRALEELDKDL